MEEQLQSKYADLRRVRKRYNTEVVMKDVMKNVKEDPDHNKVQKLSYANFAMEGAKKLIKARIKRSLKKEMVKDKKVSS